MNTAPSPIDSPAPILTATYSPEDDKIRLRAAVRLDRDLYERVKAAGFRWAPKQDLFVAPCWTPEREDLALELCGDIDDEDTSLVDRAEDRAERFGRYQERRAGEAEAAHAAVAAIADNIPLGQPILVGHHSEKRARKDAERIQNGMRKALRLWETSDYWTRRAAGALRHAKYKELPPVRHRRIKGLEADRRRHQKSLDNAQEMIAKWSKPGLARSEATIYASFDHVSLQEEGKPYRSSLWSMLTEDRITAEGAALAAVAHHETTSARDRRWIAHIDNRLAYERAMLDEQGGIPAQRFALEVGGRALVGREWLVIQRLNRQDGAIVSITPVGSYVRGVEKIVDYRAPEEGDAEKVAARSKLPPIVNFPSDGCREMTSAEWKKSTRCSEFYRMHRVKASDTHGAYRRREAPIPGGGGWKTQAVFLTDAKRVDPPALEAAPAPVFERETEPRPPSPPREPSEARARADELRAQLKAGVQPVAVDQLFPTPRGLARMVVWKAGVAGKRVLEPSAGVGALVQEAQRQGAESIVAVDVSWPCVRALMRIEKRPGQRLSVHHADFLALDADALGGLFDVVTMNPPFANGQDMAHVTHAFDRFLAPGGHLVAIMSEGVRFRTDAKTDAFRRLVDARGTIEPLPDGSFLAVGTGVRTVLVTLERT